MATSAVVVGAGPGLGAAVARRFAKGGLPVAVVSRSAENLKALMEDISKAGGKAVAYSADAANPEQVQRVFQAIESDLGPVGVLVYNVISGQWPPQSFEDTSLEAFKQGLDNSAVGAFIWCKEAVPGMKQRGQGTILFTGATASLKGGAKFSSFSPGKFALRSLSQTLARELGPAGIHVGHVIVDGMIDTPRVASMAGAAAADSRLDPAAIAETYWHLHSQPRSCWTQEVDVRPFCERF